MGLDIDEGHRSSSTYLLAFTLLCEERECHCPWPGVGGFFGSFIVFWGVAPILRRDWYRHIKLRLSLKFA